MDYLLTLLNSAVGDPELARLLFIGAVVICAVLLVLTLALLVMGLTDPVQRRLRALKGHHHPGVHNAPGGLSMLLAQVGERLVDTEELEPEKLSQTRQLLMHAGYRQPAAVQAYWALRMLLIFIFGGVGMLMLPFLPSMSIGRSALVVVIAAGVGWLLPAIWVDYRKQARMDSLRASFPDALDMLVVCVESGLSLPQSIERVADEMAVGHSQLAEELALVNSEVRAGIPPTEALRHLSDRTGLEDVRGLVSLLGQSIRFGTSVADTLRVYAEEFRDRRTQAAEEKAAMIGTKLVFPLIFCLWPSFFLIAIGPAIIGVFKAFGRL